ncbi:regulatory protein TetR [Acidimicrobium ferrooxidans DSM 10331]|uniref:Regulatory protein TetR n=1 Tax=Acidimicrobium ferrooxidans (strain DSM 10331 / JCM 15462 / NBRC 103882 / ICP) TaxID=525909 RepID=C7LZ20_ACIFD|nr:TetR/AcrR family transcriptional regulator C-terminal domain-containing protein [Acidimicrobium ferrooxidans]ACU53978.1 regulatory protein TetR [Acidimicrobium ferrooxidans DSM 10331]
MHAGAVGGAGSKPTTSRRVALTRERVVAAALESLATDPSGSGLTMRTLARRLGVAPMTIYGHVRDRDDLLEALLDKLFANRWEPDPSLPWRDWIVDAATRLLELLLAYPPLLELYLRRPVATQLARTRMDAMATRLAAGGFTPEAAHQVYAALHTYTIGFAVLRAERLRNQHVPRDPMEADLARFTTVEQFAISLNFLIEGARDRHLAQGQSREPEEHP